MQQEHAEEKKRMRELEREKNRECELYRAQLQDAMIKLGNVNSKVHEQERQLNGILDIQYNWRYTLKFKKSDRWLGPNGSVCWMELLPVTFNIRRRNESTVECQQYEITFLYRSLVVGSPIQSLAFKITNHTDVRSNRQVKGRLNDAFSAHRLFEFTFFPEILTCLSPSSSKNRLIFFTSL